MAVTAVQNWYNTNWIIDKRTDLIWFIGGALGGYLLMFMYAGLGWDMVTIWFFWVAFIDSPHFFGTYSRTYLDKQEFKHRKKLLTWSLLWFLAGPVAILLSYMMYSLGSGGYETPWILFTSLFGLWAYWHVVRQHYGFLALYKKKNKEQVKWDYYLDSSLLYGGLMLPFLVFIVRFPETNALFAPVLDWVLATTGISAVTIVSTFTTSTIIALATAYIVRQYFLVRSGKQVNIPKALFLLAVIPLHIYICYSDAVLGAGLLGFGAFVTIFHDLQYHAIVWFHHKNRYRKAEDTTQFGLSAKLTKSLPRYIITAVLMGVVFRLVGCTFEVHPGCIPFMVTSEKMLFADFGTDKLLQGLLLGFALHHYFLDQFIWRTSKDKELAKDLKLDETAG
ncbi:MAG TPA: hypothetical protein DEQ34_08775 [Balneolaceae bacterium]|nr:hypothetical protein [Balneolaceae bacterium]|tara:strand:+ start:96871 stop:98046 length:1176 start_codon:yes stop_codon:yes gene_type:complete